MKVGGRPFNLTKYEVEELMHGQEPELIQKHMVEVNGQMFPPKQVLSHVTGWPRTTFTTLDAQRVLSRLGFDCAEGPGSRAQQAGQFVMDVVRDSAQQTMVAHGDMRLRNGFRAAIGIAQTRLDLRLADLREQMKSGCLSPVEQAVYAHLDELKAEIEEDCERYWRGSGVDWRPVKQIATVVRVVGPDDTVHEL